VGNIKNYNQFLILEKFDSNIRKELIKLGVTDENELNNLVHASKRGNLAEHLNSKGDKFTFGLLNAIFLDALEAKKKTDLKIGAIKMIHRLVPIALAPFFPILAVIGILLGTSRAFNKVIAPILADPGNDYPAFLKKLIDNTMKIAEGEMPIKDRFSRAFVVSDKLVDAIRPEVVHKFSIYLSVKMSTFDPDKEVPDHYIENELREYLNEKFEIKPEIPLK